MRLTYGPIPEVRAAPWAVAIALVLAALVPVLIAGLLTAWQAHVDLSSFPPQSWVSSAPQPDSPR